MQAPRRYYNSFSTSAEAVRRARREIVSFIKAWLSGQELSDAESALGEALANVSEHGQGSRFEVTCSVESSLMTIEIHSDGCGFFPPPEAVPPPVGAIRGYGIFLMHSLVDGLEFFDNGRGIRLRKRVLMDRG